MKGLSVEEKAKRYDETIEQLRIMMPNWERLSYNGKTFLQDLVYIIPELKESEGEQHRKWILEYLYDGLRKSDEQFKDHFKSAIAWLEKQGEQKPLSHKFRIGDKVKKGYLTYTVEDIGEDSYKLQAYSKDGDKGCTEFLTIGYEKDYELVEQKPAWSEEDETVLTNTIIMLKEGASLHFNKKDITKAVDWLKSLKDRYTWKPNDRELGAILAAIGAERQKGSDVAKELLNIYQHLKKLREE